MVKKIHYCWFGNNKIPKLTKNCIKSWKKFLPDYEIILWNESNVDFEQCDFVRQAYKNKKWAFVSDYVRLKVLEQYGGIYFDTDVEVTSNISHILEQECFVGCEDSGLINAAIIGVETPNNPFIAEVIHEYENKIKFDINDLYSISIPRNITKKLIEYGYNEADKDNIQKIEVNKSTVTVYPQEYFYPQSYDNQNNKYTENSCMIHHYDATWVSLGEKIKVKFRRKKILWPIKVMDFFYFTLYKKNRSRLGRIKRYILKKTNLSVPQNESGKLEKNEKDN